MNNEDKILELLGTLVSRQDKTEALLERMDKRLDKLEAGQAKLESEMNERFDQVNERFDSLEFSVNEILKDLGHAEDRLDVHDAVIKKIM